VADPEDRRWSPRAERIAGLVESLPIAEQEFIETLCAYFRLRRGIDLPPAAVPPR
jgi:hypothetical protein